MSTLSQIPQQLVNGLAIGSVYALIAIGYTMVYGIIGMINFAHGEIYMLGAYIGMIVLTIIATTVGFDGWLPVSVILVIVLCSSVFVTSLYGYTIERLAYRPIRNSPRLVALISAIGMSVFLQNWVALGQGASDVTVPNLIQGQLSFSIHPMFDEITISFTRMLILGSTILLMIIITLYIKHSRLGRAARACSQDIHMANLLGINTNQVISFVFILGAGLAAIGGVLNAITYTKIEPFKLGFIAGMKAFTAAVLGGIGSVPGAMLGGLLLGIAETFAASFWSDSYKDIVAFGVLVLVLLFKPTGLLGKPEVEKV